MPRRTQRLEGRLGDLREIPWGTPDADKLLRLLRNEYGPAALDHAAAEGNLRQLCARSVVAPELAVLLDRPQKVRHAFRGELDWGDRAVTDVFRALVAVFSEDGSSEDVCRLAGVDLTGVDLDRPATAVWAEVMQRAALRCTLEQLIDQTLTDVSVGTWQDVLEGARDQPWRVDGPVAPEVPLLKSPMPVEVAPPARAATPLPLSDRSTGPEVEVIEVVLPWRRWIGAAVGAGLVVGFGLGWVAHRQGPPPAPRELPPPMIMQVREPVEAPPVIPTKALSGTVTLAKGRGQLVLTRDGAPLETVPAKKGFSFAPQPLDADGDGAIDPAWGVRVELGSSPCPALPLQLDRAAEAQSWKVPVATPINGVEECRVEVAGLDRLGDGTLVELDPGTVDPRRFAMVQSVKRGVGTAVPLGTWETCAACWPVAATCEDAVAAVKTADDAKLLLDHATCTDETKDKLRAMVPAPKPQPSRKKRR